MCSIFTDLKRAWRLTTLIRSTELTDEVALQLENVDSIYIEECRGIRSDLIKTSEALCRDIAKARKSLTHEASTVRKSFNRQFDTSTKTAGQQFTDLEDSLSSSILKINQLLDASQKTLSSELGLKLTVLQLKLFLPAAWLRASRTSIYSSQFNWPVLMTVTN